MSQMVEVEYLPDGNPIYTADKKTRLQLERENILLWNKAQDLQDLLDHLPPPDARIVEPVSYGELMELQEYINRVAVRVPPVVDGPLFSEIYKDIEVNTIKLANEWTAPYKTDPLRGEAAVIAALKDGSASGVVTWLLKFPDVAKLTRYDTQGSLVIRAIIARWLYLEIFSKGLAGIFPNLEAVFDDKFLTRITDPERSILEQRRWFQLMYAGIVEHPRYPEARAIRAEQLATDLEQLFSFLHPQIATKKRVLENIVLPAIQLQEWAARTVQKHNLNFYHLPTDPTTEFLQEFVGLARKTLTCEDLTRSAELIEFTDENQEELAENILPICSIGPVITYRDMDKTPETTMLTLRSLTLCVNGDQARKAEFLQKTRPSIFYKLLAPFPRQKAAGNI